MAQLLCFPQDRNVGKARHVASLYLGKRTDRERQIYWRTICDNLAKAMFRVGLSDEDIDRQTTAFKHAVENEIYRIRAHGGGPSAA